VEAVQQIFGLSQAAPTQTAEVTSAPALDGEPEPLESTSSLEAARR